MSLWDAVLTAYGKTDIPQACLDLQDAHGQNTDLLLWAAMADPGDAALEQGVTLSRRWDEQVLWPLRNARRDLKASTPPVDDAAREALREDVKAAELRAERLLLETLETLSPLSPPANPLPALARASGAWGVTAPVEALERLARALAQH